MSTRLVVVGAGGFGRETLDVIDAINRASGARIFDVIGVVDDAPRDADQSRLFARGFEHLGSVDDWLAKGDNAEYLVAVGNPRTRRALVEKMDSAGLAPATVVHARAVIGSAGSIGAGTVICGGVQVSTNVRLGRHVQLNPGSIIGHDAVLGDYVSINPTATLSGECRIEDGALIGAGAVVLQSVNVGAHAIVGASACVVRDVPADTVVKGVPAH
jgi:sugar O-acyltransferase (sialic acid O-acetyltransferase NeuD family)